VNDSRFDGIIIGAGHNGLITAAYLAKAGVKVAVFESRPAVGGGFATEELSVPGFKHNTHAVYCKIHESPVHFDLELERYGVSYIFPTAKQAFVKRDSCFVQYQDIDATENSIRRFSSKDADVYRRIARKWQQWLLDFGLPELYMAPKSPDKWEAELRQKPGGIEYLDVVLGYSPLEYVTELFESEFCRMFFLRAAIASEYDVTTKGIPPFVFTNMASWVAGKTAIIRGGTRMVAEALRRIVEEHGGKVFVGQPVQRIVVENGAAKSVALQDGREIHAERFVASSIDPVHTFLFMVGEDKLPLEIREKVAGFKFKESSLFRVFLSLKERPIFKISEREPVVNDALYYTLGFEHPDDLFKMGAQAAKGLIPDPTGIVAGIISTHDPSQAPLGGYTAYLGLLAPFELADGGAARWVDVAHDTAESLLEKFREFAPNMTNDNILGRFAYTPPDMEAYLPDMINGDICQGKICPEQLGYNRPWRGMSQYRTFIDKLYLCGSSAHPGGFAIGGPGYNAANAIAEDCGFAKWWPQFEPRKVVQF
jgi:phytoene dehydrogenase-like protein